MAGSMTISVDAYGQLAPLAQRVLCWAAADRQRVRVDTSGPVPRIVIPEEIMSGKGTLLLRRAGADVLAGYVAGTNATYSATNALGAMSQAINATTWACTASTNQPTFSDVVLTGFQVALTYANVGAAGTVNIAWGDGSTTAGAAESGTSNHTYANPGVFTITITDASSATDVGSLVVNIPKP